LQSIIHAQVEPAFPGVEGIFVECFGSPSLLPIYPKFFELEPLAVSKTGVKLIRA